LAKAQRKMLIWESFILVALGAAVGLRLELSPPLRLDVCEVANPSGTPASLKVWSQPDARAPGAHAIAKSAVIRDS